VPLTAAGLFVPGIRLLATIALLYSSAVDYSTKRPRMAYPTYLAYYLAEHTAYQVGVLAGCMQARTFRSYLPTIQHHSSPGDDLTGANGAGNRPYRSSCANRRVSG
jgi:hypothetical protein